MIRRQAHNWGGRGRPPLLFFENQKKCHDFGKKGLDLVHLWVEFSIENVVLRVSRRKNSIFFAFLRNVYRNTLISRNLSRPEKFLVTRLEGLWKCNLYRVLKRYALQTLILISAPQNNYSKNFQYFHMQWPVTLTLSCML